MAPRSQTFDPKQAPPSFAGLILTGTSQNIIRVTFDTDISVDEAGADQEVVDVIQNDARATIEVFLMQTSRANQILSDFANLRRIGSPLAKRPFLWEDPLGSDLISAPIAWVLGAAPLTRGKAHNEMVWSIRTNFAIHNYGGSDQPVPS